MDKLEITNVFMADTFYKRLLGYMFRKKPHHKVIAIVPCNSIHTFFMKFNIDVLFLNKENMVIKKISNLSKNKIFTIYSQVFYLSLIRQIMAKIPFLPQASSQALSQRLWCYIS